MDCSREDTTASLNYLIHVATIWYYFTMIDFTIPTFLYLNLHSHWSSLYILEYFVVCSAVVMDQTTNQLTNKTIIWLTDNKNNCKLLPLFKLHYVMIKINTPCFLLFLLPIYQGNRAVLQKHRLAPLAMCEVGFYSMAGGELFRALWGPGDEASYIVTI